MLLCIIAACVMQGQNSLSIGLGVGGSTVGAYQREATLMSQAWGWWESDTLITKDVSNLITNWGDITGNGHDLKQPGVDIEKPTWTSDGIVFSAAPEHLETDNYPLLVQPVTRFIVLKITTHTTNCVVIGGYNDDVGTYCFVNTSDATNRKTVYAGAGGFNLSEGGIGTWLLYTNIMNGISSSLQLNDNTPATGNTGTGGPSGITIGGRKSGANVLPCIIKAVLLFDKVLSPSEITVIKSYLNEKYSIY